MLTWLVVGPLHCVPVVGSVQLVGDQLERKNLFVDLHVGSGDVNLNLRIALLGCQPVPNNLKKARYELLGCNFLREGHNRFNEV